MSRSLRIPSLPLRPSAVIALLLALAVVGWIGVTQLVQVFHRRLHHLASTQFEEGEVEMKAGHPNRAIAFFHAALSYSPEDPDYQLNLARALRDTGRLDESQAYLLRLWERRPEDSVTNLALARLAVKRGSLSDALRYYHNAIYGQWQRDAEENRRQSRLELVQFLVGEHAYNQAQSELIALVPQLPGNPDLQLRVGQLFYAAQDYPHALATFQKAAAAGPRNAVAEAGAGHSAFQLGRYRSAAAYFEAALRSAPNPDEQSQLDLCRLILNANPFARRISEAERDRRLRAALARTGERLSACTSSPTPSSSLADLQPRWKSLDITFRRHREASLPDPSDAVMNLVLDIEKQSSACAPPTPIDHALLLIAQNPAEVER